MKSAVEYEECLVYYIFIMEKFLSFLKNNKHFSFWIWFIIVIIWTKSYFSNDALVEIFYVFFHNFSIYFIIFFLMVIFFILWAFIWDNRLFKSDSMDLNLLWKLYFALIYISIFIFCIFYFKYFNENMQLEVSKNISDFLRDIF